jgi:protein-histidine pros-kinase
MNLLTKFNLILLVLFGTGGLIISQVIYYFLLGNAQREVLNGAQLTMASARSVREYTSSDIGPLLKQNPEHKTRFLAETVPAFGALSTFKSSNKRPASPCESLRR